MTDLCEVMAIWGAYKSWRSKWEVFPRSESTTKQLMKAYAEHEMYQAQYWGELRP